MKASPFESRKPQQVDPDLNAQIAEFFARGSKPTQLPPQHFAKDHGITEKYTTIKDGKARSRGMQ